MIHKLSKTGSGLVFSSDPFSIHTLVKRSSLSINISVYKIMWCYGTVCNQEIAKSGVINV